jgi:spore coat polysaccharide biosynthesis protein SpsF (cytidylyltransferase family)
MSKTLCIIQARLGSTRLPGKSLMDVWGKPLVERVVDRVKLARSLDGFVLAIPDTPQNDRLRFHCMMTNRWETFRGSEDDVISRYVAVANMWDADLIVRVTADCPFLDPGVIDGVVSLFRQGNSDYASNNIARTFPHGLDVECFSRAALIAADEGTQDPYEREHVTLHMIRRPDRFRQANLSSPEDLHEIRLTVDYQQDMDLTRALYLALGDKPFTTADILWLFERRPDLQELHVKALRASGHYVPMEARGH